MNPAESLEEEFGPMLTEHEASRFLQTPIGTLRTWRARGGGPAYLKAGGNLRYPAKWLRKWLLANMHCPDNGKGCPELESEPPVGKYEAGLAQVGKEWLKGRLTEAVMRGEEVVAVCAEDHEMAERIARLLNADEKATASLPVGDDVKKDEGDADGQREP